jgi:hypothetical protein
MNADAARGIDVEADAGVKLNWAIWAGLGMFARAAAAPFRLRALPSPSV